MKINSEEYLARKAAYEAKRKKPKGDAVTDAELVQQRPETRKLYNKNGDYVGLIASSEKAPKGYKKQELENA